VCEINFGFEDEPDARFVLLEDCNHCIESNAIDSWMESRFGPNAENSNENNNNSIQLPECPLCKTPIRRNLRYSKYVKIQLALIEEIKRKHCGDENANMNKLNELKKEVDEFFKNKVFFN